MSRLYAGLDVSDAATAICLMTSRGACIETSAPSTPEAIAAALAPHRRRLVVVGFENGTLSNWLYRELQARQFPVVCLNAWRVHASLSARTNKTDRNDARGIAHLLQRALYPTIHVKSDEALRLRMLLNTRSALREKARALQLALRNTLKSLGVTYSLGKARSHRRIECAEGTPLSVQRIVDGVQRAYHALLVEAEVLDKAIAAYAADDPVCKRLMTVPGVGPFVAATFKAAIDEPSRFKNSRSVAAHFGLTPRTFQSGKTEARGRISRRGDARVRLALYAAAFVMLTASKRDTALRRWGLQLRERKGLNIAAVACARKLAVILHRMWMTGRDFEPG